MFTFRPRKVPSAVWLLAGLTIGTAFQINTPIAQASKPKVVATNAIICDLAKQIAKDSVDLTCLMEPGQDPHNYEMRPNDRRAIEQAKLILYGGYRYAPAIEKAIQATKNGSTKIAVYEVAVPKPRKTSGHHHHHGEKKGDGHDHDHDHDHGNETKDKPKVADAHIWHNVKNTLEMLKTLRRSLSKVQPRSQFQYIDRAKALSDELKQLDKWIKTQVKTVPDDKRVLITSHDSMGYYADAYGFKVQSALGAISTEERPSAKQIKVVVDTVRKSGVKTIFAETEFQTRLIKTMAREANVKVAEKRLFVEGLGKPGSDADSYQKMMRHNTCVIVTGLGGNCQS